MAVTISEGQNIMVSFRRRQADYEMPILELATDHYDLGLVVSGDRRGITPTQCYSYHAGDVTVMPPYLYHRSIPESDAPYEFYLIKFTPEIMQPFFDKVGKNIFEELYEEKVHRFTEEYREIIRRMFDEMLQEYEKGAPYKELVLQGMLFRLLTTIWENRLTSETKYFKGPLSEPLINAIYRIEKDYAQPLTLEEVASEAGFSAAHFSRVFHAQLGMSFTDYLSTVRIRHVQEQLVCTDRSITEIALSCGYCHGDYLATQFKRKVGMTPTQFRRSRSRKAK